jgi:phospholipid/cholesterol/gamma-HCH transport system permease protein
MSSAHLEMTVRDGGQHVRVAGRWTLATTSLRVADLSAELGRAAAAEARWDCMNLEAIDSAGAMLLWRAWGRSMPVQLEIKPEHWRVFERIQTADHEPRPAVVPVSPLQGVIVVGSSTIGVGRHLADFVGLIGQFVLNLVYVIRFRPTCRSGRFRPTCTKAACVPCRSPRWSASSLASCFPTCRHLQLKQFGADIFIINILGLGIVRELGPVLTAVLVAGRSGSAMTAQLGVMRVTEEIDALATMGISAHPAPDAAPRWRRWRMAMPLLTLWTSRRWRLLGGMVSALDAAGHFSYGAFFEIPAASAVPACQPVDRSGQGRWPSASFVALIACHFGLRVQPNTESLSTNTTASVVTSITAVILLDADIRHRHPGRRSCPDKR